MSEKNISFFMIIAMVLFGAFFATSVAIKDAWKQMDSSTPNRQAAISLDIKVSS